MNRIQAVDDLSFDLHKGQTLAIVGESGCGKTSLTQSTIAAYFHENVHTYSGQIILDGVDVMQYSDEQFRKEVRWVKMATVPQASMNSVNPKLLELKIKSLSPSFISSRSNYDEKNKQQSGLLKCFPLLVCH